MTISQTASAAFVVAAPFAGTTRGRVSPGNSWMFPWLSQLAPLYEKYRFLTLSFTLVPGNPSTVAGRTYLALDTDVNDPQPTTATDLLANENAITGGVWESVTLDVDVSKMNEGIPWRYTGSDSASDVYEPRTTYAGQLVVASAGVSATSTWDLMVSYSVEFSIEQLQRIDISRFEQGWTTTTDGTKFDQPPMSLVQTVAGKVKLNTSDEFPLALPRAIPAGVYKYLDMADIRDSWVHLYAELVLAAVTPYGLASNMWNSAYLWLFDAAGAYLGDTRAAGIERTVVGKCENHSWAAGESAGSMQSIHYAHLLEHYPTLRYLMPVFTADGVAAGASLMYDVQIVDLS